MPQIDSPEQRIEQLSLTLRRRMREAGYTQLALSQAMGMSRTWVTQELLGNPERVIKRLLVEDTSKLDLLAQKLEWSSAEEMMQELDLMPRFSQNTPMSNPLEPIRGRWLEVRAFAGGDPTGIYTEDFQFTGDKIFVRAEDDPGPGLELLTVTGDSMAGGVDDLQDGDVLYVDTKQIELQDNKIFVVKVQDNGYMVKRVRKLEKEIWLFSDNQKYSPIRPKQVIVIGRVAFSARVKKH